MPKRLPFITKLDRFMDEAINKMFTMVGFKSFDPKFAKQKNWYSKKSWSKETEQRFKKWFFEQAKKDLKWNKKTIEKEYSWFNFMYGWSVKDD